MEVDDPIIQSSFKLSGMRSALFVPLRRDNALLGYIVASSPETRVFTKQITTLQNFAAQAVIAMDNARQDAPEADVRQNPTFAAAQSPVDRGFRVT